MNIFIFIVIKYFLKMSLCFRILGKSINRISRFVSSINQILRSLMDGKIYLEGFNGGIIYFCRDLETFKKIHQIPSPSVQEKLKGFKFKDESLLQLDDLITRSEIPQEGFKVIIIPENKISRDYFDIIFEYFKKIHHDVKVEPQNENKNIAMVTFETYDSLEYMMKLLYMEKILEKREISVQSVPAFL